MKRNILITGGAGFIGSHVVRLFVNKYPNYHIFNLDKLTYAGNLENVADVANAPNYTFIQADICDYERMKPSSLKITSMALFTSLPKVTWIEVLKTLLSSQKRT